VAITFEDFNCPLAYSYVQLVPILVGFFPAPVFLQLNLSYSIPNRNFPSYLFWLLYVGCTEGTHKGTIQGAGQFWMRQVVLIRASHAV
jgi:hypothetical protein